MGLAAEDFAAHAQRARHARGGHGRRLDGDGARERGREVPLGVGVGPARVRGAAARRVRGAARRRARRLLPLKRRPQAAARAPKSTTSTGVAAIPKVTSSRQPSGRRRPAAASGFSQRSATRSAWKSSRPSCANSPAQMRGRFARRVGTPMRRGDPDLHHARAPGRRTGTPSSRGRSTGRCSRRPSCRGRRRAARRGRWRGRCAPPLRVEPPGGPADVHDLAVAGAALEQMARRRAERDGEAVARAPRPRRRSGVSASRSFTQT